MRRPLWLAMFLLWLPWSICAQTAPETAAAPPTSDQVQKDILKEVRLLRAELLRASLNANRAQMLLARVRAEHEQVIRVNLALNEIQDKLDDIRVQVQRKTTELRQMQGMVKAEVRAANEAAAIKLDIDTLKNREAALIERQKALNGELDAAQAQLTTLNAQLDQIDRDMAQAAEGVPTASGGK